MKEKICPNCGTKFESKYSSIYCSQKCKDMFNYRKRWGNELKCERCGKPLKGLQGRFCSPECKREIYRQARIQANPPQIKHCAYCGKEFSTRTPVQKYCSCDCASAVIYVHAKTKGYKTDKETFEPGHKPKISLEEAARLARAAGKTYGEMFAPPVEVIFPWAMK